MGSGTSGLNKSRSGAAGGVKNSGRKRSKGSGKNSDFLDSLKGSNADILKSVKEGWRTGRQLGDKVNKKIGETIE